MLDFLMTLGVWLLAFLVGFSVAAKTGARLLLRSIWKQGGVLVFPGSDASYIVKAIVTKTGDDSKFWSGRFSFLASGSDARGASSLKVGDLVRVQVNEGESTNNRFAFTEVKVLTRLGEKRFIEER